jgi:hypothetical protein
VPQANLVQTSVSGRIQNALAAQGDGLILPKLSTGLRTALGLTTADAGLSVYDTTAGSIYWWTGTAWSSASAGSYSDGTWLAQLIPAVGTITEDPAVKTGYWSRIGNTVTISMKIRVQAIAGGPTGLLRLDTLPYPAVQETAVSVSADLLNNGAKTTLMGYAVGYSINLYHYENGLLNALSQHVPAGGVFWVSGSYLTT